ncbi:MAG: glycosyltransferase family A protein [Anaerolineae bacterium]|nr:glycosyltransferase family A protein [Anaerolineae bacterium]
MQNHNPLISVIVPVYNGEAYLSEALESILSQTYQPLDIIVIDDGSTDNSRDIAESFIPHLRYYYQPNAGVGSAMSAGVTYAKWEYLAFLDADDLWMPDKLTLQMTVFMQNPGLGAVFTKIEQFYSSDIRPEYRQKYFYTEKIVDGYCVDTLLVKKEAYDAVGSFDPIRKTGTFIEWYTRAMDIDLPVKVIPIVTAKRRIHNSNMGIWNIANQRKGYTRILKSVLDRRRAKGAAEAEKGQS